MFTAARRPQAVASLALIEPPAFHVTPAARELADASEALFNADLEPVAFLRRFFETFADESPPDEVLEALVGPAKVWRAFVRRPWQVDLPLLKWPRAMDLYMWSLYVDRRENVHPALPFGAKRRGSW